MLPSSFFSTSFDKTFSSFSASFSLIKFFSGVAVAAETTWLSGTLLSAGAAGAVDVLVSGKMIPFKFFLTSAGKLTIRYCSLSFLLLSESLSSLSSLSDLSPTRKVFCSLTLTEVRVYLLLDGGDAPPESPPSPGCRSSGRAGLVASSFW